MPFENNIVVAFWANDTSGGGILDPGAVIGGIGSNGLQIPKKYEKTVGTGLDIIWDNAKNCGQEGIPAQRYLDCNIKQKQAVVYTGIYIVTTPVRVVAAVGNQWAYKGVKS